MFPIYPPRLPFPHAFHLGRAPGIAFRASIGITRGRVLVIVTRVLVVVARRALAF